LTNDYTREELISSLEELVRRIKHLFGKGFYKYDVEFSFDFHITFVDPKGYDEEFGNTPDSWLYTFRGHHVPSEASKMFEFAEEMYRILFA